MAHGIIDVKLQANKNGCSEGKQILFRSIFSCAIIARTMVVYCKNKNITGERRYILNQYDYLFLRKENRSTTTVLIKTEWTQRKTFLIFLIIQ